MLLLEPGDEIVDYLGKRPADCDRVVEGQLDRLRRRNRSQKSNEDCSEQLFHLLFLPVWILRPHSVVRIENMQRPRLPAKAYL